MISNLYFCIGSLFYSIMLLFVYFTGKKKNNLENKTYAKLIVTNFIGILIGFACFYTVLNYELYPTLNYIISRIYLLYLLAWISLFAEYIFIITNKLEIKDDKYKMFRKYNYVLYIISAIIIFVLPLKYVNNNGSVYSYGAAAQFVYVLSELYIIFNIISMFKNSKNFNIKKYSPLFIFIAGGIVVMLVQSAYPELLLMTSMEIFVTYMIYFTMNKNN